jgi:hypothetical protein
MPPDDRQYREDLLLTQQYRRFDAIVSANEALDAKATTLLGASSLIVSLFGAVGLFRLASPGAGPSARLLVLLLVLLFAAMVITVALAWWPRAAAFPGGADWPAMKQRFLDAPSHEAFTAALSDCIAATGSAVAVNRIKGRLVRASFALFIAQLLILVLLLATFPPSP